MANNPIKFSEMSSVIRRLYECGALKLGQFKLKSGVDSPVYIDLRLIISQPDLLVNLCNQYVPMVKQCRFDLICGVPYTALVIATYLSAEYKYPMVMRRKEAKQHGTKQNLEGIYQRGQRVLIIEDLISSGSSILETALVLRQAGLVVNDAIVLIDREQNGIKNLEEYGIKVHTCIKFNELINYLKNEGHITAKESENVLEWIRSNHCSIPLMLRNQVALSSSKRSKSYGERVKHCINLFSKRLLELMEIKRSNLCVAADLRSVDSILKLANLAGPHIVMLKTHVDIIKDFNPDFVQQLKRLAREHNFLLFEDRKFADIGSTVAQQYSEGTFRIHEWAHLVSAHLLPGPGLIKALKQQHEANLKLNDEPRACVLISHLSSKDNLVPGDYAQQAYKLAMENQDFIVGFISQSKVSDDPTLIHITPGVRIEKKGDDLGQQYITPEDAIQNRGADVIVVGRGITSKLDSTPEEFEQNILQYRQRAYDAYMNTF